MELKNCGISDFIKQIEDKKIICVGFGKQAFNMYSNHDEIINNIQFFVDNDEKKHGKKCIKGKCVEVYPFSKLLEVNSTNNIIILITSVYFTEIFEELSNYSNLKECVCYVYPLMEEADEIVYTKNCKIEQLNIEPIPKVIHYCWFGRNKKSDKIIKCIDSWKKMCTDYKIIEWNEENFDINMNQYVREAYAAKKYAFVSDFVRLYVLYNYGGIYMDTDVEVIKSLDELLYVEGFSGFETKYFIPTGIIGAQKGNLWIKEQLETYIDDNFLDLEGIPILTTNVDRITEISKKKHGFIPNGNKQILKHGMVIYPKDFFCPKYPGLGVTRVTDNTYTIHHFELSWLSKESKEKSIKLQKEISKFVITNQEDIWKT